MSNINQFVASMPHVEFRRLLDQGLSDWSVDTLRRAVEQHSRPLPQWAVEVPEGYWSRYLHDRAIWITGRFVIQERLASVVLPVQYWVIANDAEDAMLWRLRI